MNRSRPWSHGRLFGAVGALSALLAVLALLAALMPADSQLINGSGNLTGGGLIYRIEEDWSLSVNQTNSSQASPQVSTQMARSPTAPRFCNFHLNSIDFPAFQLGGLQLQAWKGSSNTNIYTSPKSNIMSTDSELVSWTQYLRNDSGSLCFGVGTIQPGVAGSSSQTWGDFSGMEITVPGASLNLDNYSPDYSVGNSGVTFGANRVDTLTLSAIRYYYITGTVVTDSTPRVVYSSALNSNLNGDN